MRVFGAVDLGASGGRVVAGLVDGGRVDLEVVHRFPNGARPAAGRLRWDLTGLHREVLAGLRALAAAFPGVESIGVDTWAVDYGLLDVDGRLLAEPVCHRDDRTADAVARVHALVPPEELYAVNGLQFLPFNTVYQLEAEKGSPLWARAARAVLLPDLIAYWLTGELRTEVTNASTTGLLDARTGTWSRSLHERLGIPVGLFPPLQRPGEVRGPLLPEVVAATGLPPGAVVTAVGSHDTASAVVALPASGPRFAYVSSGTWSLAGVELPAPVLTGEARLANVTNEGGVDGRTRFLRNVGGLWLLQECSRAWGFGLDAVLAEAEALPAGGPVVDVDDPAFIPPGDMPDRIAAAAVAAGHRAPASPAETVRCVLDSLAAAYARTVERVGGLAGVEVETIHVVGGGSRNALLCRLTAELSGRVVVAGPVEATALGNVLVQARAHGAVPGSLEEVRAGLARTCPTRRFTPGGG
ncbi:rhamnulokinase [Saccharothrix syringae]|uniref:Rhamnulokinase n=1 Tax=Saccharothrix syringae TaxID=103733 RepID=A0A5Q0H660_SACSY|nr:rhamnulokinase family protein [Saccharothrix syringae]QFZ21424.1 rhamnulokinase [Saccharothrix syringae]